MANEFGFLDVDVWVRNIVAQHAPIKTPAILAMSEVFTPDQIHSALERQVSAGNIIAQTLYTNPPQTSYVPSDFVPKTQTADAS